MTITAVARGATYNVIGTDTYIGTMDRKTGEIVYRHERDKFIWLDGDTCIAVLGDELFQSAMIYVMAQYAPRALDLRSLDTFQCLLAALQKWRFCVGEYHKELGVSSPLIPAGVCIVVCSRTDAFYWLADKAPDGTPTLQMTQPVALREGTLLTACLGQFVETPFVADAEDPMAPLRAAMMSEGKRLPYADALKSGVFSGALLPHNGAPVRRFLPFDTYPERMAKAQGHPEWLEDQDFARVLVPKFKDET